MHIEPVTLTGRRVELVPLSLDHHAALAEIGCDASIWRWYPYRVRTPDEMRTVIEAALGELARGASVPFATRDLVSGRIVGSTRFMNIDRSHRRVEIGGTWLSPEFQRTHINTEAKHLMLRHAFEVWRCIRVEFKTDALNERSRAAIARLGAREEGILRNHMVTYTGRLRDSVYFSVLDSEWPDVRERLAALMNLGGGAVSGR